MVYQYKFEKIMSLREKEKTESQTKYNLAVKEFETEAEKLYRMLKKKEELLDEQAERLRQGLSVQQVRHNLSFLENHEQLIQHYQRRVIETRNKMNFYHQILVEKNMEVKKYEKMKEKDVQAFMEQVNQMENRQMDEISIQQYMSRS
ncbi:flagellar export protein FliJ [Pradoshia eiseniae]|uniref:Flagellar FliJ protein n=1 Tax=Pradoshia eiseniae TaxID=2064768 RepID=A0A2S7N1L0_9BACI|nr:flagellar export protein FliJ [Pradoshia eiseniae]PQD95865.1 flagellar export protein FliJ [Pradoshia eiseniae]